MYKNNFTKFGQKNCFFSLLLQYATVPHGQIFDRCYSAHDRCYSEHDRYYSEFDRCYSVVRVFSRMLINSSKFILESIHCTYYTSNASKSSQTNLQAFQGSQRFIVHLPKSHKARGEKRRSQSQIQSSPFKLRSPFIYLFKYYCLVYFVFNCLFVSKCGQLFVNN